MGPVGNASARGVRGNAGRVSGESECPMLGERSVLAWSRVCGVRCVSAPRTIASLHTIPPTRVISLTRGKRSDFGLAGNGFGDSIISDPL